MYETLISLKQTKSVVEFHEQFKLLSSLLKHVEENFLFGAFMNDLREDIKAELWEGWPKNLARTMDVAHTIQGKKNWALQSIKKGKPTRVTKPSQEPTRNATTYKPNESVMHIRVGWG